MSKRRKKLASGEGWSLEQDKLLGMLIVAPQFTLDDGTVTDWATFRCPEDLAKHILKGKLLEETIRKWCLKNWQVAGADQILGLMEEFHNE